jgi:hypothetical protein
MIAAIVFALFALLMTFIAECCVISASKYDYEKSKQDRDKEIINE